jgi:hypothetical protein
MSIASMDVKSLFSDPADFVATRTVRLKVHSASCHSSFKDPDLFKMDWIQPDRDPDP